ncbi:MAG: protein-L-isoaspartate(D-aspartate) O-methyltransferase [Ignavibacteriaceae bacterium]|nr:protein-L-isoaspartate(D-aspartate) O-methyltransferase [Ignavibacteriaceae bacterium]HRN27704.1 protein-L-isoaspartate(D-aspartate) O-methyltransferase [Ignavibacteriaceae bacterium]HRP94183.1 protein-L-isoaspartate(D-aspartate) O-methyltransferase [Ignavibacteriaceae bacterium]
MFRVQREELVDVLTKKGINDLSVIKAIGTVPREKFIEKTMQHMAYKDIALPIGYEQTISQPYTVAFMTQLLNIQKPGMKILEIGTGSGYQAAILFEMQADVYSIERNLDLHHRTTKLFDKLGIRVHAKYGDGTIGWKEFAPFDGIIVTAGSPIVPNNLKEQLAVGGRLIIPVGDRRSQKLYLIKKISEKEFDSEVIPEFSFVPLIGREGWKK